MPIVEKSEAPPSIEVIADLDREILHFAPHPPLPTTAILVTLLAGGLAALCVMVVQIMWLSAIVIVVAFLCMLFAILSMPPSAQRSGPERLVLRRRGLELRAGEFRWDPISSIRRVTRGNGRGITLRAGGRTLTLAQALDEAGTDWLLERLRAARDAGAAGSRDDASLAQLTSIETRYFLALRQLLR